MVVREEEITRLYMVMSGQSQVLAEAQRGHGRGLVHTDYALQMNCMDQGGSLFYGLHTTSTQLLTAP
jgi:hypothetical protein